MSLQTPFRRANLPSATSSAAHQIRHASMIRRPHRPYTFTQLVALCDGSSYKVRTTSPAPIYRSTKDSRNHPLWQPSSLSLQNVEADEAGRLRSFRRKFGRGWDQDALEEGGKDGEEGEDMGDSLMDLISGAGAGQEVSEGKGKRQVVMEDPGERIVNARTPGGKVVQVKTKDLEAFRKSGKENW